MVKLQKAKNLISALTNTKIEAICCCDTLTTTYNAKWPHNSEHLNSQIQIIFVVNSLENVYIMYFNKQLRLRICRNQGLRFSTVHRIGT